MIYDTSLVSILMSNQNPSISWHWLWWELLMVTDEDDKNFRRDANRSPLEIIAVAAAAWQHSMPIRCPGMHVCHNLFIINPLLAVCLLVLVTKSIEVASHALVNLINVKSPWMMLNTKSDSSCPATEWMMIYAQVGVQVGKSCPQGASGSILGNWWQCVCVSAW